MKTGTHIYECSSGASETLDDLRVTQPKVWWEVYKSGALVGEFNTHAKAEQAAKRA